MPSYSRTPSRQKLRVAIVVLDNFTLNAFSGFVDALRLAADEGGRSRQIECGWVITGYGTPRASCGLTVTPERPPVDPAEVDYIAISGGNDYYKRHQPSWVDNYLREADAKGVPLIGLCTGTFNIARAGLLNGRMACVHWNVREEFRAQFPEIHAVSDRIFLDAGDRITCAGSTGASDLALHLIARHCGPERAQQSLRHMMLGQQRAATFPQAYFVAEVQAVSDDIVRRSVNLMEQTLNRPVPAEQLAARVGLSERQLNRRFHGALGVSVSAYYRSMRLRYGAWRLTHTLDRVAAIATDAGFSDAAHFGREFRRVYGATPIAYRRQTRRSPEHSAAVTPRQ